MNSSTSTRGGKEDAHKEPNNKLNFYEYILIKDKLEPPEGLLITLESIKKATQALKNYIARLDDKSVYTLIQLLNTVHGRQREFTT